MSAFLVLTLALASTTIAAREPQLAWQYEGRSNLYAPPVVADMTPSPGREIVISDSEAGVLRCVSAAGEQLWEFDGNWAKRLVSSAVLSEKGSDGLRRLAIANGDGSVTCLSAETGALLWRREPGAVEWGGALWMPGVTATEQVLVVPTGNNGIYAYTADGELLWRLPETKTKTPLRIRGGVATADVDGDGLNELFGASGYGIFRVNHSGELVYEHDTGDDYPGGVALADADHDGKAEIYAASRDDAFLWRFDADTGNPVWKAPLYAIPDTYSAGAIAVGDLDGNGQDEIVLGDSAGHVYAFSTAGMLLWTFQTLVSVHITVSLGDVTGDGQADVLAASGDHNLYCLDGQGRLQWRYGTEMRLIFPPSLADVDGDGMTDILLCGSDRKLRCLSTGAHYSDMTMPWPSRRFNTMQSGSSLRCASDGPQYIETKEDLDIYGDFERYKVKDGLEQFDPNGPYYATLTARPQGWRMATLGEVLWTLSEEQSRDGSRSLRVDGAGLILSEPVQVSPSWRSLSAALYYKGGPAQAYLQWLGDTGTLREDRLSEKGENGGWMRLENAEIAPPAGARYLVMALESGGSSVYWDAASIQVVRMEPPRFEVLVNQAGYDVGAPKRFVVQANFKAEAASYEVIDGEGVAIHEGMLENPERITGYYGQDWGHFYYTGEFSEMDAPGNYRIRVIMDGAKEVSWPFEVDVNRLWKACAKAGFRFFYYQRCGMAVPGFHEACHLDDATGPNGEGQYPLWGGWHDAGDYNKYHNAPYVYGLACAYTEQRDAFDALGEAPSGFSEFFDEILWGGDHVRRMVMADGSAFGSITSGYGFWGPPELETDNISGTGDERPGSRVSGDNPDMHQAALARIAALLDGKGAMDMAYSEWVDTAARSLDYALKEGRRGLPQLSTAVDLFICTKNKQYADLAASLCAELFPETGLPDPSAAHIEAARRYDAVFGTTLAAGMKAGALRKAEQMLAFARNPFGVCTFGPADNPNFFGTPADKGGWRVGTNSHLLEAAAFMAMASRYESRPEFMAFIYNQFNWVLGMNPYNISMMEGVGSAFSPSYHHRYVFSGVKRGAVPGGVVNGITWRSVGDDRPRFDMSGRDIPNYESNEVWLPHNTALLNALAQLLSVGESIPR